MDLTLQRRHLLGLAAWPLTQPSWTHAMPAPDAPALLTVRTAQRQVAFGLSHLERLPHSSYSTSTPWYHTPRKFSGPTLRTVLDAAGATGTKVRALALNDYTVTIPMSDLVDYEVLLGRLLDDKPLAVRDMGPLFIIYPFHRHPELRDTVHYSRCAWQLTSIEVA